jgi:UDP-glucose 4-epimerase
MLMEAVIVLRVLIVGVSGFLGAWTARSLINTGHATIGLVRPSSELWRIDDLEALDLRVVETSGWPAVIEEAQPEVIVSLDWAGVSPRDRGADTTQRGNLIRIRSTIRAAIRAGTRRFVGVGSQAEYGPQQSPSAETTNPQPITEYGKAKLRACEESAELTARAGIEWAWARVFSSYGPLDREGTVLATIADRTARDQRVALSSGVQPWSYLSAADTARALTLIATTEGSTGIINVAHPEAPPLQRSLIQFAQYLGGNAVDLLDFSSPGAGAVVPLRAEVSRLMAMGWNPEVPTAGALANTARWLSVLDEIGNEPLPERPFRETS